MSTHDIAIDIGFILRRDGGWVSLNIGTFGVSVSAGLKNTVSVSVNICILWSIGIGWIEIYSIGIGKNNTDPPSLLLRTTKLINHAPILAIFVVWKIRLRLGNHFLVQLLLIMELDK